MQINIVYLRPNIHKNGLEILEVNFEILGYVMVEKLRIILVSHEYNSKFI